MNGRRKLDTPGNSAVLREMQRWEEIQALRQVVKHFIVGCVLGQGAGVTSGEDAPPKCDRLKLHSDFESWPPSGSRETHSYDFPFIASNPAVLNF